MGKIEIWWIRQRGALSAAPASHQGTSLQPYLDLLPPSLFARQKATSQGRAIRIQTQAPFDFPIPILDIG